MGQYPCSEFKVFLRTEWLIKFLWNRLQINDLKEFVNSSCVHNWAWNDNAFKCSDGLCLSHSRSNFTKGIGIVLGAHDLNKENEPGREIKYGETLIIHPDYDEKSLENNIALIKLNNPVMFNGEFLATVQPLCSTPIWTRTFLLL